MLEDYQTQNYSPQFETSDDARTWASLCHIAGFAGYPVPGVGFFLGPLIVWLLKKEESPFIDHQGREALNFQISFFIISFVLGFVTVILTFFLVGVLLWPVLFLLPFVQGGLMIMAALRAREGEAYRYPCTLRFL